MDIECEAPALLSKAFPGWSWRTLAPCTLRVDADTGAGLDLETSQYGYLVEATCPPPAQEVSLRPGKIIIAIEGTPLFGLSDMVLERTFGANFRDGAKLLLADAAELQEAAAHAASSMETDISMATASEDPGETVEVDGMVMQSLPARNRRKKKAAGVADNGWQGSEPDPKKTAGPAGVVGAVGAAALRGKPPATLDPAVGAPSHAPGEIRQFEYMDHTADVVLHSWGASLEQAFAQVCVCMYSYMTDLDTVEPVADVTVEASGHDILDLLYHLLDELLFSFSTEFVVCRSVEILELDSANLRVKARGRGEKFDLKKHPQGTEIKAITMHQMKILTPDTLTTEEGVLPRKESAMEGGRAKDGFPYECFVLVDI